MEGGASLEALLAAREVVVFCGSGGVGKTSVAAAAAMTAAARLGGKVLVLTIDPARRLADALGLEAVGNVARRVPLDDYPTFGSRPRGALYAAMLDTKRSWDELVLRHAPDEATAYRILDNRLYDNLTSRFVQSHDYIAMERLYELHSSGGYDLIVVDTPPTRNAIDFLEAPARMSEFFGGRLLRWLTMPYRVSGGRGARMINVASRPFYSLADRVLGSQFLQDIAEFFLNFESMYWRLRRACEGRRSAAARSPDDVRGRHHAGGCAAPRGRGVLRRAARPGLPPRRARAQQDAARLPAVAGRRPGGHDPRTRVRVRSRLTLASVSDLLADEARTARVLRTLGDSFHDYEVVARREAELRAELARLPDVVVRVPNFDTDITDVAGLARVGECLFAHG